MCKFWLALIFVAAVAANNLADQEATDNDSKKLVTINGSEYYISPPDYEASVRDAVAICNEIDMNLISLQTAEKESMIVEYLLSNGDVGTLYWTSGMRFYENTTFMWTGLGDIISDSAYTNWADGQPDNLYLQNVCLQMSTYSLNWWDTNCNTGTAAVICEQKYKC